MLYVFIIFFLKLSLSSFHQNTLTQSELSNWLEILISNPYPVCLKYTAEDTETWWNMALERKFCFLSGKWNDNSVSFHNSGAMVGSWLWSFKIKSQIKFSKCRCYQLSMFSLFRSYPFPILYIDPSILLLDGKLGALTPLIKQFTK